MSEGKLKSWLKDNREVVVAGVKFLLLLGAFFLILTSSFVQTELVDGFNGGIAKISSFILNHIGIAATNSGDTISGPNGGIKIVNECNGLYVTALLASAIMATPTSMMARTFGVAVASLAIYALNLLRAVVLFYLNGYRPKWFDFFHVYVFETVVVVAVLAIFMAWTGWALSKGREVGG